MGVQILAYADCPRFEESAERIAVLLESAITDSAWVRDLNARLEISQFHHDEKWIVVKGNAAGVADGHEFSFPIKYEFLIEEVSVSDWARQPVVAFILAVFRAARNEQDPKKKAENWTARAEFDIVSRLEAQINKVAGAPVEGARLLWRNALIASATMFLIAAAAIATYDYIHPHPRRVQDSTFEKIVVAILCGFGFGGLPAGLGGLFLGLAFARREVEDIVAGQSLLRTVGVQNVTGLRTIGITGAVICFGLFYGVVRLLITRG